MLMKARAHGIDGPLLRWLTDWTRDRCQRVVLNGVESSWAEVMSSVVQGSVLGPILFLIFINDIDLAITAADNEIYTSKFADDTKIGREIMDASDSIKLQTGIDYLVKWCNDWGMSLHPGKCAVIHFGWNNPHYDYFIEGIKIKSEEVVRDLGVHIENNCDPSTHIDKITKKAQGVLAQIRRSTILRDRDTVSTLYKSFVRPLVESAVPAWNPWKRGDIEKLEKVQRRALRMITDLGSLSYDERLKSLGMESLENRRRRGDVIQCYKTMKWHGDIDPNTWFEFVQDRHDMNTRTHEANNIVPEKCNLNVRKHFYTNRVANIWNELPQDVRNAPTTNSFKNHYDRFTQHGV